MTEPAGFEEWWNSDVATRMRELLPWASTDVARACFASAFSAGALRGCSEVAAAVETKLAIVNAARAA